MAKGISERKHKRKSKYILNETILNILWNFIPHEIILCDDRDPSWFNNIIKSKKKQHLNGLEVIDIAFA